VDFAVPGVLAAVRTGVMRAVSRTATGETTTLYIRLELQKPPTPTALTLIECPSNARHQARRASAGEVCRARAPPPADACMP